MVLKKKNIFCLLFFLFFPLSLVPALDDAITEKKHSIEHLFFLIEGNSKEKALRNFIDIKEGDQFSSEENLRMAAERAKEDLINYRVFKVVTMEISQSNQEENLIRWNITFTLEDSWTFLPIAYPKYDSNHGLRVGAKIYYDNAFGSMTDTYLGLGINFRLNPLTDKVEIGEWLINLRWENIKKKQIKFNLSYQQEYKENIYADPDLSLSYNYSHHQTTLSLSSKINFPSSNWYYSFKPSFAFRYIYKDRGNLQNYREEPFSFSWNHSSGWGRLNWIGNFKRGQNYSLSHSLRFVFDPTNEKYFLVNHFTLQGIWHLPIVQNLNYYARTRFFASINDRREGVGDALRGIADASMSGFLGMTVNNSLAIRFWRLKKIWDAQVHPFFDFGFAIPRERDFDPKKDWRYSIGTDWILYLDALPNLVARGTFGIDLGRYAWDDLNKYELIITTSLSY